MPSRRGESPINRNSIGTGNGLVHRSRAYDNQGAITIMRAKVDDQGVWTFTGGGDIAPAAQPSAADASGAVRSMLTVSTDRSSMTAKWERSDDGSTWQPWMDMTFTRMP